MKMVFSAVLVLATCASVLALQNDLSFYPVRSLAEALDGSLEPGPQKADYYLDGRQLKSRSHVVYSGEVREIKGQRRKFVEIWIESRGMPKNTIKVLEHEVRFQEGATSYWMPVRQRTLDENCKALKGGESVDVYTILAGHVTVDGAPQPVFIVGGVTERHPDAPPN